MHVHILGICGTFMAGLARLAQQQGHRVTGADVNVYPPMSDFLATAGIPITVGWDPSQLQPRPDLVVIGNALSRGNPVVEYVLNEGLLYCSGPAWVAIHVLRDKHVLAVAGTHGKTTTTSLLAWLLECAGLNPGFLIGGLPENFGVPARLGGGKYFVIEADEYDSAFFDKRSKFVHYAPRTLVINNLELDHVDIFADLNAVMTQFHHLVRTVPGAGTIIWNSDDRNIEETLQRGCWSSTLKFGTGATAEWRLERTLVAPGTRLRLLRDTQPPLELDSPLNGQHNAMNATAAICAAQLLGIPDATVATALPRFKNVKRRLELVGKVRGISVYDDFAHHPTAIAATLQALRERVGNGQIIAVLEPRSNSMRRGAHQDELVRAFANADQVVLFAPSTLGWDSAVVCNSVGDRCQAHETIDTVVNAVTKLARRPAHVLIMSNGAFGGIHQRLIAQLGNA
ncbi:MAG: UDP-N-acetylmuramate:L-alanyl-gamma-D-glutamyl-meso-diaminopimelate ligase [Gammaproteobacteria bacterium]|nr:UDP-N-acetylmuramate:L-alanyl-gamma-D-glutamyl-meso-diaminopimelate ligase [Gammaproteobacteria bacterium]